MRASPSAGGASGPRLTVKGSGINGIPLSSADSGGGTMSPNSRDGLDAPVDQGSLLSRTSVRRNRYGVSTIEYLHLLAGFSCHGGVGGKDDEGERAAGAGPGSSLSHCAAAPATPSLNTGHVLCFTFASGSRFLLYFVSLIIRIV